MHKEEFIITLLILLAAAFLIFFGVFFNLKKANASFNFCNTDHVCITPTPSDCDHDGDKQDEKEERECITPTPTELTPTPATPSATPTPVVGSSGGSGGGSQGTPDASNPTCNIPFDAPKLQGFKRLTPTSVEFSYWGVANVDKYSVVYGLSPDQLIWGMDNIDRNATSFTLNDLPANTVIWAKVYAYRQGCSSASNVLDP